MRTGNSTGPSTDSQMVSRPPLTNPTELYVVWFNHRSASFKAAAHGSPVIAHSITAFRLSLTEGLGGPPAAPA